MTYMVSSGVMTPPRSSNQPSEQYYNILPLERVVGFAVAEATYDLLNLREQLIIDLLAAEWTQTQIAQLFCVSQPSIASSVRRIRFKLADKQLRMVLDARMHFRETRPLDF